MSKLTKEEEEEITQMVREIMSQYKITMLPDGVIVMEEEEWAF